MLEEGDIMCIVEVGLYARNFAWLSPKIRQLEKEVAEAASCEKKK